MTLKTYTKADDIPEGFRSEYKQSGSVWVPDLADDHPVLVLNKTLKQEKEVEEAKVKKLRSDLDDALEAGKTSGVPRGHVAVAKADAELLDKYKPLGTPDELTAIKTEHGTLKQTEEKRAREDNLRLVAKELNFNADAFILLPNLPEFEIRDGKDGKKTVVAKLKDDKGVVTEKPATEFIESNPAIAPLLPALKVTEGVRVHTTAAGVSSQPPDQFAWAREFGKQYSENAKPVNDLATAFKERTFA